MGSIPAQLVQYRSTLWVVTFPPNKISANVTKDFLIRRFRNTGSCAGTMRTVLPGGSEPGVPVWSKPRPRHVLQARGRRRRVRRSVHPWGRGRQEPGWVSTLHYSTYFRKNHSGQFITVIRIDKALFTCTDIQPDTDSKISAWYYLYLRIKYRAK